MYATLLLAAEWHYAKAFSEERDLRVAFRHVERAAELFPYQLKFRNGPARLLTQVFEITHGKRAIAD